MLMHCHKSISLFLFSIPLSTSAPIDNPTYSTQPLTFVGYVSEPNVRGTTSLVLSCFLTLVLCVWSALHLNVPEENSSRLQRIFCNIRWIITGVYAPELVVFTAWRQWASAKLLGKLVQNLSQESRTNDSTTPPTIPVLATRQLSTLTQKTLYNSTSFANRRHKWTKTHDFFASTGGFAFEIPSSYGRLNKNTRPFLPSSCPTRLTLTARGVAFLAMCNHLPDVPERDIRDKSKANDMAKAFVVIQASWMLLQTVGRLIAGLPVTLLEVNTVAHVACVFVIYLFWWNKPLLPNEPFIIDGDWVEPLCAYMYMSSELSGEVEKKESQTKIKTLFAFLNWYSKTPEIELISLRVSEEEASRSSTESEQEDICPITPAITPSFQPTASSKSCLSERHTKQLEKATDTAFFERRPKVKPADVQAASALSAITRHRWALAAQAIEKYPTILASQTLFNHDEEHDNSSSRFCTHFRTEELLVRRVQNWPSNDLLRDVGGLTVGMGMWLASLAYGAVHAAAWDEHFPSVAEMWLWRAAAVYVGFCGGLWIVLNYVARACRPFDEFWERWMDGQASWFSNVVIGGLVVLCGLSFCLARLFIVVEAVISIRSLPAAAYITPDWTQVFPHF